MLRTIVIVLNLLALGCLVAHGSESSHTKKDTNTMQRASKNPIMCPGQFQSPIALDSNSATYLGAESEAVVDISESATHKTYLVANYGYFLEVFVIKGAWKITLNPKAKNYYKADGLRFFWRSVYTRGTEHTLDGESFPLELKQLRSLQFGVGDDAKPMQDNFRPVQQLNAVLAPQPRMLYKSWPSTAGRIAPALFVLTLHLTIITFSN
ncbi:unnamed protein product [Schistocephalus solidus]|uniref:Alpha-carbonic anhydrase domain-containing protein n=1 Tax=Schistocephalus solidus TaxID=70667 RepID=A0A183T8I6_SCHSO|nr:unnamed protein product [Schistocephalus solidus]